jgi:uncharacterized protein (TIGR00369 family)
LTSERTASAGVGAFEFEPHNCFACGSLNEHGLHLDLHLGDRRSWTQLILDPRFEGWAGIAHGGIIATILDEVMAWALVAEENWGVTARMKVDYRRPILVGTPIRGEGWIVRSRRRLVDTAGRIVDADGNILASAEAVYVAADEARKRELRARYGYRVREVREAEASGAVGRAGNGATSRDGVAATPEPVASAGPGR